MDQLPRVGELLLARLAPGGGYCFYRDARLRRLTRYRYNNVPTDVGGRYFYVNDGGDVWSPSYAPVNAALDSFECRHGLGYSRITGERNGVRAELLLLVPLGHTAEVHQLTLRNTGPKPKRLTVFSFVEFCLWNAYDDMTNFQRNLSTGEVEIEGSTIYHKTEYRERRNHFAFYHVNATVAGFDTDREAFLGPYNGFGRAQVPSAGRSANSVAQRLGPDRLALPRGRPGAGRAQDARVRPGLRREPARPGSGQRPASSKRRAPTP